MHKIDIDDMDLLTMLELINQLDGFDARGNIKVLMATNRPDTVSGKIVSRKKYFY